MRGNISGTKEYVSCYRLLQFIFFVPSTDQTFPLNQHVSRPITRVCPAPGRGGGAHYLALSLPKLLLLLSSRVPSPSFLQGSRGSGFSPAPIYNFPGKEVIVCGKRMLGSRAWCRVLLPEPLFLLVNLCSIVLSLAVYSRKLVRYCSKSLYFSLACVLLFSLFQFTFEDKSCVATKAFISSR